MQDIILNNPVTLRIILNLFDANVSLNDFYVLGLPQNYTSEFKSCITLKTVKKALKGIVAIKQWF